MRSITEKLIHEKETECRIEGFLKKYKVGNKLSKANVYKVKGYSVSELIKYLIELVFTKKSMYMNIKNGTNGAKFGKDTVYRFLNSSHINWTSFLLQLAIVVIVGLRQLTSEERKCAIVIDDTLHERARSKKVELLSNVHDHVAKSGSKYKRGFRMLTAGWTDGASFIPLQYRHLSSQDSKNRYNEINAKIDKRSVGYKIRKQAISGATQMMLSMLRDIKKACIPAKHVLFDSWFSYPSTMMSIHAIGFDVIGRLKDTKKIKYLVGNEKKTLKEIYASNKKNRGRAKHLLSVEVLLYNDKDETLPARIVYVRDRNKRNKWIAFCSTDMSLSEKDIIALYGKRWDIEVFFKICKSYLNLGKEFQGLSYDFITAHTAIVLTRYIMLAVDKRSQDDPRSIGELFFLMYDEIPDKGFSEVIEVILTCLHEALTECSSLSDDEINRIIDLFIDKLSSVFKRAFRSKNNDFDTSCA
ncbi:MAG: transposase [Clostridiales bacterium]|jgi:hypothetical protein|nr:transposase [Clostridiales bacterium]